MKRRIIALSLLATVLVITTSGRLIKPFFYSFYQVEKQIIPLDKNLTIVTGGGGNSGILVTKKGVIVIDTKMAADAGDLFKLVKEKAGDKKGNCYQHALSYGPYRW